jgi:hypothetical protein
VRRGARVVSAAPVFRPNGSPPSSTSEKPECTAPYRDYGRGYELVQSTEHLGLYRSAEAALDSYPIVRHVSFFYGQAAIDYAS